MKRITAPLLLAMSLLAMPAHADGTEDSLPEIWGNLIYETDLVHNPEVLKGIYRFSPTGNDADTLTMDTIYVSTMMEANGGGVFRNGKFQFVNEIDPGGYYSAQQAFYECTINDSNIVHWTDEDRYGVTVNDMAAYSGCLTMDPVTGKLYGIYPEDYGYSMVLSQVDFDVLSRENIGEVQQYYLTLSINRNGEMYGIDDYGDLYKIDMTSGAETLVGETGVTPANYYQSAAFDQTTGKLWWAARTDDDRSVLYEVNTETGAATQRGVFPWDERFLALYIPDTLGIDTTTIGLDKPAAPAKAVLDGNETELRLTWSKSKGGLHNGKIADSGLSYKVALYYGDEIMDKFTTDTTVTFSLAELGISSLTPCHYAVQTLNDSVASDSTISNNLAAGMIFEPDYVNEFNGEAAWNELTVLDANNDKNTWEFVPEYSTVRYRVGEDDANDWLLTPMLRLEGGQEYIFKFQASPQGREYPETINAAFGEGINTDGYTQILSNGIVDSRDSVFSVSFTPENAGIYHVGLQIVSLSTQLNCILDNISVVKATASAIDRITADDKLAADAPAYNLAGQRVNKDYKGIIIANGRKLVRK